MRKLFVPVVLAVALLGVPRPAHGQFGFPQVVIDPAAIAKLVTSIAVQSKELAQTLITAKNIVLSYELASSMARNLHGMPGRYRSAWTMLSPYTLVNDVFYNVGSWQNAANRGGRSTAQQAYEQASIRPLRYQSSDLDNMSAADLEMKKSAYASVELADSANIGALDSIGSIRGNSADAEAKLKNLEDDSFSDNPDLNTEVSVLNKVNAAQMLSLRRQQDEIKLLTIIAEALSIKSKTDRDAMVVEQNADIQKRQIATQSIKSLTDGADESLANFTF